MGTLFACLVLAISAVAAVDFTEFVDTKIGGSYRGHTFPGATCPFSLVQASPDTGLCDWDHCSGYVWEDPCIYGFSQTHLSGTGCPDLADVRLLPFTDDFDSPDPRTWRLAKDFRTESGRPGFYTVALTNAGVVAELTATPRVGVHRYTYAPGKPVKLLVDLQWANVGNMSGAVVAFSNRLDAAHAAIVGGRRTHAWLRRSVSWKVVFDRPWKDARLLPKADPKELAERWVLEFEPGAPLVVKAAISTVDEDGAAKNYAAEAEGKTFDDIRAEARAKWQALLGRFEVPGASAEQRTAFYTALYHLFIQPNNIADVDGRYRGGDAKVATAKDGVYYTGLSLWDTFRAAHPFYTIAVPERVDGFVNSMLGHYRALGFLPVIPYFGWESHCMIGNHSVPVIVDAYKKGFRGFDVDLAFEAVTNSLTVLHTDPFGRRKIKENWDLYDRYGYYPFDEIKGESVSRTLECSFDDWCAAEFCHALGRGDEAFFRKRANYWKNLFDPETRLMRGRTGSGSWRTPFDPFSTGHDHNKANDYTEGNAWQYTWHVLHDPQGLVAAMGGPEPFVQRLDSVFRQPEDLHDQPPDVTGLIGQYVHGNEPSHHVAYFYSLAGAPRRTAEVVREVCDRFYGVKPGDLCGNDDCGQMSAWYVFAAMGFYPFNPASGEYVIGAPQVPEVRIRLGNGEREFRVVAKNLSRENKYVKSVTLNGKPVTDWKIRHADIMAGGELVFEMTAVADCAEYVDPFIGTSATGHTFPAACVPFGLVQAGPDTAGRETMWWHYCSGYRHEDDRIAGFSQTHLNGTGGIDLGDVRILPMSLCTNDNCHNCSQISNANSTCSRLNNSVKKLSEVAEPGYYAATLDGGIKVEVAAAEHAAIYRIKFEKGSAGLLVDLLHGLSLRQNDNANKVRSSVAFDGKTGLSGTITRSGWVTRDVSFSIAFDRPFASVETLPPRKDGETAPRYVFDFDLKDGETLMVKIALSAEGGAEAAKRNLAAEIPGWNFDAVKDAAHVKWNEVLSRATVEGTDEQKKNWYTALYHLFIQPNNIADVGEKPFYSTLSLWDTFRAAHPLYTILAPEKAAEFVDSMLEQGRRTGYLPIWTLWGKDNQCMIGTHSVPVIVDWFLKEGNGERGTVWILATKNTKSTKTLRPLRLTPLATACAARFARGIRVR
ncbi:MAG: GH92 family glycosyl hydrolase [Kiritimatiellae bacterium]|nr:GH92 family glycosyl hydrolase [Kiritimatiellia bacterium]